ncbi:MAG TPA: site-2 protease family protein [Planctomycetaceae bacterium]|nr:site-2 protease family protein [Planctomycetaceae bacterium]
MNERYAALSWSVPCGRWFGTRVRVSVFFVFVPLILMVRFGNVMGAVLSASLFFATLLHEFGHVFACRMLRGAADEILIWPLGGLASLHYPRTTSGRLITIFGGPIVNLVCCVACWPQFYASEQWTSVLNPMELPQFAFSATSWPVDTLLVFFAVNWLLLVLNLIPAWPLDGGQAVWTVWHSHSGAEAALRGTTIVGMACGWIVAAIGLMTNLPWAVALGAVLLIVNISAWQQRGWDDEEGDSFLGYDFSEGYTSLERDARNEATLSWWRRWQQRRREQQAERERERLVNLEQQLDVLLTKVHEHGIDSLSAAERRLLREASESIRDRSRRKP